MLSIKKNRIKEKTLKSQLNFSFLLLLSRLPLPNSIPHFSPNNYAYTPCLTYHMYRR